MKALQTLIVIMCLALVGCAVTGGSAPVSDGKTGQAAEDFAQAIRDIAAVRSKGDAVQLGYLSELSPGEWDGRVGEATAFVVFDPTEGDGIAPFIARVGIDGYDLSEVALDELTALYGAPVRRIEDAWSLPDAPGGVTDVVPGRRAEVKWVFPGGVALIYHAPFVPTGGGAANIAPLPMPTETSVRF